jgi:arginyl-tRNA synthetase
LKDNLNNSIALSLEERNLLLCILDFRRSVQAAFDKRATDIIANYAYDLCQLANTFYHNCPILRDDVSAELREHRLKIASKAYQTLSAAIDLMGLKVPEEM